MNVPPSRPSRPEKPRLVILSHVLPFPRSGGQQQRVHYTLRCAARRFHLTFATIEAEHDAGTIRRELSTLADEVVIISRWRPSPARRAWHAGAARIHALATGLKSSNYYIGRVHFPPDRVERALDARRVDCVLFEYWHAAASTNVFRRRNIPCVLDMHDILWHAYARQLQARPLLPDAWRRRAVERYRRKEEHAWRRFDALVAINRDEERYVRQRVPGAQVIHAPMGTDLSVWPYSWNPASPPRLAYYGSLASPHNQADALRCARRIMPLVWERAPDAELWVVGANPPERIRQLAARDRRIHVTGFVEKVQPLLATMTLVLCPWSGTYGFRSRIVEVMALGVPVLASPDAVAGMELDDGEGLALVSSDRAFAETALALMADAGEARDQSMRARRQVERRFSLADTYERMIEELAGWLRERGRRTGLANAVAAVET